ncbi:50S ribosomal protein L29 [archaeon CG_4_10_14_0_2_um_filter_Archaea_38_6]|nr:MAG: 50S ribosomal protein L29 [archaeon CG07_land_8_20_14_0_80_38_8]PIU88960.1 MAG: 50S ribosomal protein L29 [archaeon CG06_land_8_20_14_3_00_37_11]PJA22711.1 MAG: 50S ribosomal protein L29 [archaeon CG_4_10_14_0_2_um_filter_Archaea_38_6]
MTIAYLKDLKKMSDDELEKKMEELKKELMKKRTQISSKQNPDKPGMMKEIKKAIARIKIIKHLRGGM